MGGKRAALFFPRMLLEAILLMVFIGMIAFCGVKSMEKEPLAIGADIAVVVQEENTMTQMALKYIENMESVSSYCRFLQVSEADGMELLKKGEVAALILLPRQLIEGILNGENPSIEVIFPNESGIEAMLFKEFTDAGAELLTVAQAEIYGAYDTAVEYGMLDEITVMYADINSYNLAFALDRLALYDSDVISATGSMSLLRYYTASAIVLFLLLFGMALYPFMQTLPQAFRRQLARQGVGEFWQGFGQWLCGLFGSCIALGSVLLVGRACGIIRAFSIQTLLASAVSLLMVTTYIYLIYSVSGSKTTGILLLFLLSVGMVYASGGIVPSLFMPEALQRIGAKLPTAYLIQAAGGILTGFHGRSLSQCMTGIVSYTAVFGLAVCLCRRVKKG